LVKYTRDGHKVRSIVASRVGNQLESLRKAYAVLGIEVESLELDQRTLSGLSDRWEQMVKIVAVIRKYKPDVIFTHDPADEGYGALSHGTVGRLVTTACAYSASHSTRENTVADLPPHRVKLLLYYLSNMWTPTHLTRKPDLFIDISDTVKLKDEAWRLAQAGHEDHVYPILRENRFAAFRMYGVVSGCYFAEAFTHPYDRLGKIALNKIPEEWLTSYRSPDYDHESLSLPDDF
jgi:LmbE family N-acetylglucosaminyl deacetylase